MYNVNNTRQFQCFLIILIRNNFMFEYHQHHLDQIRIRVFFDIFVLQKNLLIFGSLSLEPIHMEKKQD